MVGFCVGYVYCIYLGCIVRINVGVVYKICFLGNIDSYFYCFINVKSVYENLFGVVELFCCFVSCIGYYLFCCLLF